jgi:hypothetical protein
LVLKRHRDSQYNTATPAQAAARVAVKAGATSFLTIHGQDSSFSMTAGLQVRKRRLKTMAKKKTTARKPAATKKAPAGQKVTFSYFAPAAQSVLLAGDFTGWDHSPLSLKKLKTGTWKTTVALRPGEYQYRLLVDGQWIDDPQCRTRRPNQFGSQNCICVVNGG